MSPASKDERSSLGDSPYTLKRGRYGRYAGLLAVLVVLLAAVFALTRKASGVAGIPPGQPLAPFAAPLATGHLPGVANTATHAHDGAAGSVPACKVRGSEILNICELYERGPVVLALFVDGGSCPQVLSEMQSLAPSFPGVQFAAVAIGGDRAPLRTLVRSRGLSLPVGIDEEGVLATLYKVVSCPQLNFAYPGGIVQSKALLATPSPALLRARVGELVAGSKARGWREQRS